MPAPVPPFTRLPGVDAVLSAPAAAPLIEDRGRLMARASVRAALAALREELSAGEAPALTITEVLRRAQAMLATWPGAGPRPVFNLTGTVIHTNLGRAPLAAAARQALLEAAGASTVEFDLHRGQRGRRDADAEALLRMLTGAEAATVVNNCAAAVLLVLNTLAWGREVPVSRSELVEIGGSFRLPEIMTRAGARLVEVGTTNRTHAHDYAAALGPETGLVMKVHPSNYAISGFTAAVDIATLARIAHERDLPLIWDLGSGALVDGTRFGLPQEPLPQDGLRQGADLVLFSGDKLLGGPQCGLIVGRHDLIEALRANPMNRALRVDKLTLAALVATLRIWGDPDRAAQQIPALALLLRPEPEIRAQAEALAIAIAPLLGARWKISVEAVASQIGSGAQPVEQLPSAAVAITPAHSGTPTLEALATALRGVPTPVIGRIKAGKLLLDCRTLHEPALLIDQFRHLVLP